MWCPALVHGQTVLVEVYLIIHNGHYFGQYYLFIQYKCQYLVCFLGNFSSVVRNKSKLSILFYLSYICSIISEVTWICGMGNNIHWFLCRCTSWTSIFFMFISQCWTFVLFTSYSTIWTKKLWVCFNPFLFIKTP